MIQVKPVYRTSKGIFWNREDAEKKCNRVLIVPLRFGDPREREDVIEEFVLCDDEGRAFTITKVDVK